jgi:hypothetical protein
MIIPLKNGVRKGGGVFINKGKKRSLQSLEDVQTNAKRIP